MWITRDEEGLLDLWSDKPYQTIDHDVITWTDGKTMGMPLDPILFPDVTFENSPMEVELKLIEV